MEIFTWKNFNLQKEKNKIDNHYEKKNNLINWLRKI
jgi:hypothetical protein